MSRIKEQKAISRKRWHDTVGIVYKPEQETQGECIKSLESAGYRCKILPKGQLDNGVVKLKSGAPDVEVFKDGKPLLYIEFKRASVSEMTIYQLDAMLHIAACGYNSVLACGVPKGRENLLINALLYHLRNLPEPAIFKTIAPIRLYAHHIREIANAG